MRTPLFLFLSAAVLALPNLSGCARPAPPPKPRTKPSGPAAPTPFPIAVDAGGINATIFDSTGKVVAKIKAVSGDVAPANGSGSRVGDPIGNLRTASAILYQNGKPTSTIDADQMNADRDTRILIGTGNVRLHSLTEADSPTIRADTMTWRYNLNSVVGHGHVLITRDPDLRVPGDSFTADTQIHRFTLNANGAPPASGTF